MAHKPSSNLPSDASPSLRAAMQTLYDNLDLAAAVSPGTDLPKPFTRLTAPDAPRSVQLALNDIADKTQWLAAVKQAGTTFKQIYPSNPIPTSDATPSVQSTINDLYNTLALALSKLKS